MRRFLHLGWIAAFAALAGCGFTPLYSTKTSGSGGAALSGIRLAAVTGPDEAGHHLAAALATALPASTSTPVYEMSVSLRESRRAIAVTQSSDNTRFDYVLSAEVSLKHLGTGDVRRQRVDATTSYGVVASQYATLVGRQDAVRRTTIELARKIELDTALFLKGRAPQTNTLPGVLDRDLGDGTISDPGVSANP